MDAFVWLHHIPEKTLMRTMRCVSNGAKQYASLRRPRASPAKDNISAFFSKYIELNAEPMPVSRKRDDSGRDPEIDYANYDSIVAAREESEEIRLELKKPRWVDVFKEYKLEIADPSVSPEEIGADKYFIKVCRAILEECEPKVYVVKNLGVAGDCRKCLRIDFLLKLKNPSTADQKELRKLLHPKTGHRVFVRKFRGFFKQCSQAASAYVSNGTGENVGYIEMDCAGQNNTFVPWFTNQRSHAKHINCAKKGLKFKVQMNVIAGHGLCLQYALPYLKTGADFNLTCMLRNLVAIHKLVGGDSSSGSSSGSSSRWWW